jgi:hypothetical protein
VPQPTGTEPAPGTGDTGADGGAGNRTDDGGVESTSAHSDHSGPSGGLRGFWVAAYNGWAERLARWMNRSAPTASDASLQAATPTTDPALESGDASSDGTEPGSRPVMAARAEQPSAAPQDPGGGMA